MRWGCIIWTYFSSVDTSPLHPFKPHTFLPLSISASSPPPYLYMILTSHPPSPYDTQAFSHLNGLLWLEWRTFNYPITNWVVSDHVMDTLFLTLVLCLHISPCPSYTYMIILNVHEWDEGIMWIYISLCLYISLHPFKLQATCFAPSIYICISSSISICDIHF